MPKPKPKPQLVECEAQRVPGGRWLPAFRRLEPHNVSNAAARRWAAAQGVAPGRVGGGHWYSVAFNESSAVINGTHYRGGSGWREVPAAQVREVA